MIDQRFPTNQSALSILLTSLYQNGRLNPLLVKIKKSPNAAGTKVEKIFVEFNRA